MLRRHPYTTLVASGLLLGTVYCAGLPGISIFLSLIPLFFWSGKLKTHYLIICFFAPFYALVLSWFLDTNVLALVGFNGTSALLVKLASLAFMTSVLTLCMLPLGHLLGHLKPLDRQSSPLVLLLVPSAWVVSEWLRSIVFGAILYGNGASVGDYWNFGSLGLGLMDSPFAHLTQFIGMYGLSFLAVFVSLLMGRLLVAIKFRSLATTLFAVVFFSAALHILNNQPIGSNILSGVGASVFQREDLMEDIGAEIPTQGFNDSEKALVVLPEYSEAYYPGLSHIAEQHINNRLAADGISIDVDQGPDTKWYGTLEFRNKQGQIIGQQTKQLLIPTGEYMPAFLETFFRTTNKSEAMDFFNANRRLYKGDPPKVYTAGNVVVGPVACSGILARSIYRSLALQGANVFTNSASLSDFNQSRSYFRQSLQMARFHAVANSRYFIQSSRGASAFVLNEKGQFIVKPDSAETKFIDFNFVPLSNKTIYTRLGDWPLVLSGLILLVGGCMFAKNRRQPSN